MSAADQNQKNVRSVSRGRSQRSPRQKASDPVSCDLELHALCHRAISKCKDFFI